MGIMLPIGILTIVFTSYVYDNTTVNSSYIGMQCIIFKVIHKLLYWITMFIGFIILIVGLIGIFF